MNELQLALVGVGVVCVGSVWAYNKWQERKDRRSAEDIVRSGEQADVLFGADAPGDEGYPDAADASVRGDRNATGAEPHLSSTWAAPPQSAERIEPGISPLGDAADSAEATRGATVAMPADQAGAPATQFPDEMVVSPWADAVADAVMRIGFTQPFPAPSLWAAQVEWAGQLGKPLNWVAQVGSGGPGAEWRRMSAHDAGRYTTVAAALQLADRRGPVGEIELTLFAEGVAALAAQLGGAVPATDVPDISLLLAHAQALDEFCASVDVQLSINIVDPGGAVFAGTKLRGLAEAAGMQLNDDGRYHARDDDGNTLYTLGNLGAELFDADTLRSLTTHGVTLTLDVPNVPQGARIFDRMVATARQFSQVLGGMLVDAQRAPLADATISGIRARIEEIQARMAAQQIIAGSARARRLFS